MKKLYIPTSTLNFNNIFACESISPATFYSKRNFGYKTIELVECNGLDNSILLYDKLPVFEIIDKERDNFPMIIEIECQEEDIHCVRTHDNVSVFKHNKTIYINPFSTKIIFLSELSKKITLLGSERSLSTKMVNLYNQCGRFYVVDNSFSSFQFKNSYIASIVDAPNEDVGKFIDIDQRRNRAKGFMYSYLLGENKSLNKELVTIKKCAREINNIVSAVLHSPDKKLTNTQNKALESICRTFTQAYERIDENAIKRTKVLDNILFNTKVTLETARTILGSFGYSWEEALNNFSKRNNIGNSFDIDRELKINFDNIGTKLNEIVITSENKYLSTKIKNNPVSKIVLANLRLTMFVEEKADFFISLVNEFLSNDFQGETKVDIAVRGITIFKELLKENNRTWEDSSQRTYFNEMLANLQGKGSFDVSKDNNLIRQSFALFVLNKDDIDKLESALISNIIPEYRYAFGLWGAMFGFANMPKTLTNDLFLSDDLSYISEVYKYIHRQVHGVEIEGELGHCFALISTKKVTSDNKLFQDLIVYKEFQSKDKRFQDEIVYELNKIGVFSLIDWDDRKIDLIEWKSSKGQKKLMSAIKKSKNENKPKKEKTSLIKQPQEISTFQFYQSTGIFLKDFDFISTTPDFIKIVANSKDWEKDLKWFIESHERSHKDYDKYWKGKPTDNESVIKQFIFLRKEKYKDSETLLRQIYLVNE